jgi:phage baseplate assembly protein V
MNLAQMIAALTEDLRTRARLMVGRAILTAIQDSGNIQTVQVQLMADEIHDNVERIQEYGFTSVPKPGAEAVVVCVGGTRDHGLVIAVDDRRYRLKGLQGGEVALYTDEGDKIHLKRNHVIDIVTTTLNITANTANVSGNLNVQGNVVAQGDVSDHGNKSMLAMRTVYNAHAHTDPQGGSVGPAAGQM